MTPNVTHPSVYRRRRQHAGEGADDGVSAHAADRRSSARCSIRRSIRCRVEYLDGRTNRWFARVAGRDDQQRDAVRLTMIPSPATQPPIPWSAAARCSGSRTGSRIAAQRRTDESASRSCAARRALARRRDRGGGAAIQPRGARAPDGWHCSPRSAACSAGWRLERWRSSQARLEQALRVGADAAAT